MATLIAPANLSTAQAGNGDSTNVLSVPGKGPSVLRIANTAGATPTVTINIQGSINGTDWFNVPYATVAAPATEAVAAITVTATAVNHYYVNPGRYGYGFLKLVYSANTNETLTADLF